MSDVSKRSKHVVLYSKNKLLTFALKQSVNGFALGSNYSSSAMPIYKNVLNLVHCKNQLPGILVSLVPSVNLLISNSYYRNVPLSVRGTGPGEI